MTEVLLIVLIFSSALGCGLIAGAFFGFSAFVMKAFARLPSRRWHRRNAIGQCRHVHALFVTALFGTA